MKEDNLWYIWSNEHNAWWGPRHNGYFSSRLQAGHYTWEEARKIINDSNCMLEDNDMPNETMIPVKFIVSEYT